MIEKLVVVTKPTALEELITRFNSRAQAKFYIEHLGASFAEYEDAHSSYHRAVEQLKVALPRQLKHQVIAREFLPTFQFGERDLVITLGPDGLVVNTAKYLTTQPILAVNPDPQRIDGLLLPFQVRDVGAWLQHSLSNAALTIKVITMAQATLNDGQKLYAVNDLFIGQQTHVSARYLLRWGKRVEPQSSSGIIVSTGMGSTGWLQSVVTGAAGVTAGLFQAKLPHLPGRACRLDWSAAELYFAVREPFPSKASQATMIFGKLKAGETLDIISQMPEHGVIFSDGIEADYVAFQAGVTARIGVADRQAHLIMRG